MSELIVLAFQDQATAEQALEELKSLQKQNLITLSDAATVIRTEDGKTKVKQAYNLVGIGTLGGAFWGTLIGLLFMMPWLGLAIGAITGALGGKLSDFGIDDDFIKEVSQTVEPGHAALFLLIEEVTADRVIAELEKYNPTVLRTNLSAEDEAKLRETFSGHEGEQASA